MSYEVYIDVRHHPRHLDDNEEHLSDCGRFVEPSSANPTEPEKMRTVVAALRDMADHLDPDWHCTNCGRTRGLHDDPTELPRCPMPGREGPITQWAWWREVQEDPERQSSLDGDPVR